MFWSSHYNFNKNKIMSISHIPDLYLLLNGMCFGRYPAPNLVDPLKNGSRIRTPTRSTLYFVKNNATVGKLQALLC